MLFSSYQFLIFLWTTIVALFFAGRVGQRTFLLTMIVCSLVFYGWLRADYTLILAGSAGVNFAIATGLEQNRTKVLFGFGIAFNLILLGVFKYADFAVANVNALFHSGWTLPHIALPLALSFITFEQISFLSDVRSKKIDRGEFLRYFAFVTFFPKLIAGPIIRYRELLPQLGRAGVNSGERLFTGLCLFCFALFKKVAIADGLAPMVDQTVSNLQGGGMASRADAISALLAYSLQIFFDFSSYSEMAIGIAWMFGIQLPVNFNSPYKASSLIDFWRRWHITLSSFLRDYVYFPLGGEPRWAASDLNESACRYVGRRHLAWGRMDLRGLGISSRCSTRCSTWTARRRTIERRLDRSDAGLGFEYEYCAHCLDPVPIT
jgi:alginate O-acetyltransferase complex protein AlgI